MSPEEVNVLELIWSHFKKHGDWPQKARFAVLLRHQGVDFNALAGEDRWISASSDKVRVSFDALLVLPEVKQLLEPLPRLLRLLARRFEEQADPDENPDASKPRVESSEFFALWGDGNRDRAILAARLLEQFLNWHVRRTGGLDSDKFYFTPELDNLRYEHVESLDGFMAIAAVQYGKVRREPRGRHLDLLRAVYASLQQTGHWPPLVRFTLEHRDKLGFIPELVSELSPVFIRNLSPQFREPRRIVLANHALPYVAGPTGAALAASIVRAVGDLWFEAESSPNSSKSFTIEQIADKLKLPVEKVLPIARLLEDQPWGWANPGGGSEQGWYVIVRDNDIQHFMGVRSWEEYVRIRDQRSPMHALVPEDTLGFDMSLADSPQEAVRAAVRAAVALVPDGASSANQPTVSARAQPKVFLGHGHSHLWRALKDFLQAELQLDPVEFNSATIVGQHIVQRLNDILGECKLAFLVMTPELEVMDEGTRSRHARQNVIHEIGLFQGRLGFEKTIILRQQDCAEFSNNAGVVYIEFPPGKIEACFEHVRRVVRKLLPEAQSPPRR
ncbi:nucleotide-binding protein [Pyxidicoccus parkwayensis]|uniref:Nucleotide-binding protein n=1 Tax=Pyxidicoccus parkwayensis TaxID=2813578 RepID=A0ABX7P406_9BACT|nr:TIR domain-containing protein [Pyxidicoccus parkwaysis]QSQ25172.1 nucleotide-binding protein [Pyxidicoccus parkwaysis]